jgi:cytochrome c5
MENEPVIGHIYTKSNTMKKGLVILSVAFLVACASTSPMVPTQKDADRAAKEIPGITLADLNEGKAIFEESCRKCHSLKKPFNKTDEEIKDAMPRMAKRAKIDERQSELVYHYLVTMSDGEGTK